jgi:hypothetical protein
MVSGKPTKARGVQAGTRLVGKDSYQCPCGHVSYSLRRIRIHARSKDCPLVKKHGLATIVR